MIRHTNLFCAVLFVLTPLFTASAQDVDVPGNLTMVDSTASEGNILKGSVSFIHNFGTNNTFVGSSAGNLSMTGQSNSALGWSAWTAS